MEDRFSLEGFFKASPEQLVHYGARHSYGRFQDRAERLMKDMPDGFGAVQMGGMEIPPDHSVCLWLTPSEVLALIEAGSDWPQVLQPLLQELKDGMDDAVLILDFKGGEG